MKIGFPNIFSSIAFLFTFGFALTFTGGILFNSKNFTKGMNGAVLFFVLIAIICAWFMLIKMWQGFILVYVNKTKIVARSFLPFKKTVIQLSEVNSVGWNSYEHMEFDHVRAAVIRSETEDSIRLTDLHLENLDSILDSVPWSNTNDKKRVNKKQAKENIYEAVILLVITIGAYAIFIYQTAIPFTKNRMLVWDMGLLILCIMLIYAYSKRCLRYGKALANKKRKS